MFEFEDSRLGKIKVISVTEARSAIATIMTDKTFNYVITKNNRPIRVIINYDTYRTHMAPLPSRPSAKSARGSIKGLIETREKELKNHVSRYGADFVNPPAQEIKKVVGGEPFREEEPEAVNPEGADPKGASLMEETPEESPEMKEEIIEVMEEVMATAPEPPAEPLPVEPEADYFGVRTSPQQSDYFTRFRKLYEAPRPPNLFRESSVSSPPAVSSPERGEPLPEPPMEIKSPPEKRERGRVEPPSIQDLLRELESTKLSGEE